MLSCNSNFFRVILVVVCAFTLLFSGACETGGRDVEMLSGDDGDVGVQTSEREDDSVDLVGGDMLSPASSAIPLESQGVFATGHDVCYMVQTYFPKTELEEILPKHLSIPDDAVMSEHYPDTLLMDDAHPFLMIFCHGRNIHDVYTKIDFPEQEELMFLFPVIYTDPRGEDHLCSYTPVLYLDSFIGTVGGLIFGLRKEYHAEMEHGATETGNWWRIEGLIEASFVKHEDRELDTLPRFMAEIFANPTITLSYPTPFARLYAYDIGVEPSYVASSTETFTWHYEGTTVEQNESSWSVYSEFDFTMGRAMLARKFFQ